MFDKKPIARRLAAGAAALVGCALVACSAGAGGNKNTQLADGITRAVYNNDYAGVTQNFDSTLAGQVTRSEVGDLSDRMHKLGDYSGLTEATSNDSSHKYTYLAKFSKGALMVEMRLDSDGKVAAYRVVPQQFIQ